MIGDMLTLSGAFLNGISLIGLEHAVKRSEEKEFLGLMGLFGSIVTVGQM